MTQNATVDSKSTSKRGRKRALLAVGTLLGIGALVTAAAFTDNAWLGMNGDSGWGGQSEKFNIQADNSNPADLSAAVWGEHDNEAAPSEINLGPTGTTLVPDDPASVQTINIPVKNATPNLKAAITMGLKADLTKDVAGSSNPTEQTAKNTAFLAAMQFEVLVDGTSKGTLRYADFPDASPLALDTWLKDSAKMVTMKVSLVTPGGSVANDYNGGGVSLVVHFQGSSVV